jgi:sugar phosphate isomerase/epimerase
MKLAFSTAGFLDRNLGSAAVMARECGYEGIDIGAVMAGSVVSAAGENRRLAGEKGVEVCCLTSAVEFVGEELRDRRSGEQIERFIDAAAGMGCPFVQVGANTVSIGRSAAPGMLADWLGPLGDRASKCDVGLLLVNQRTFGSSRDIWAVLDRLRHPAVGSCWDVLTAAVMEERPGVSVPTLNSRIRLVRVGDAFIGDGVAVGCAIGDGDVAVQQFVHRLRGIGYGGYFVVELPGDREMLTASAKKLRGWWGEGASVRRAAKQLAK